tara:strand:+ start:90 stop:488 length:399 start_codon:yes stop_codon:yes gene_type:complete
MSAKHQATNRKVHAEWLAEKIAAGWIFNDEYRDAGLPLTKDRRFLVQGKPKPGWYKFKQHVINPKGSEWIECFGPFAKNGTDKVGCGFAAIAVNRIARVEQSTPAQKKAELAARKTAKKADRERAKELTQAA